MDVLELEGIDDDLEPMETDLDRPMSRLSVMPDTERPSANELRLGKKVHDLEKERDSLAVELKALKAKHAPPTSTTIPVPAPSASTPTPTTDEKIEIPHALLPILDVMRHHISELTRDNQAMRYTFGLDSSSASASSSKITLDGQLPTHPLSHSGLDLHAVVKRVRELVKENEELGDLVLEAGKVDIEEWELALEDSKKVIVSLEHVAFCDFQIQLTSSADLQHHADIVQQLRQELEAHKATSHSNRDKSSPPPRSQASGSQSGRGSRQGGQRGGGDRHGHRLGHGPGQGAARRQGPVHGQGQGQGQGTNTQRDRDERGAQSSQRDRDRDRDRDRERNKERDKEREKDNDRTNPQDRNEPATLSIRGASGSGGGGWGGRGSGSGSGTGPINDFGPGGGIRREDDRASKRRR